VVIARAGKPIARIVRVDAPSPGPRRRIGFLKGQLEVPDDFDHIGADEIVAAFDGGDASAS
jgi:antitoxin (DNA-binding transcriptional repressor) of toxin-antitoxin stability system